MISPADPAKASAVQAACVDRIGNLTLSGYNSDLSTTSLDKKTATIQGSNFSWPQDQYRLPQWARSEQFAFWAEYQTGYARHRDNLECRRYRSTHGCDGRYADRCEQTAWGVDFRFPDGFIPTHVWSIQTPLSSRRRNLASACGVSYLRFLGCQPDSRSLCAQTNALDASFARSKGTIKRFSENRARNCGPICVRRRERPTCRATFADLAAKSSLSSGVLLGERNSQTDWRRSQS